MRVPSGDSFFKRKQPLSGSRTAQWRVQLCKIVVLQFSLGLWNSGAAMHLLSTYLYSFPRGNILSAALLKRSGKNAVFIALPDMQAHGCSSPAVLCLCCWRAVLSPCLLNPRQRKGWTEVICLASEVTWSLSRGMAFLLCWGNDLHCSRSSTPEKNIMAVQVFGIWCDQHGYESP